MHVTGSETPRYGGDSPRPDGAASAERRIAELRAQLKMQQAKTEEASAKASDHVRHTGPWAQCCVCCPHQWTAAGRWVLHLACRCEVLHAVILLVPSGSACTAALPPTLMSGYALQIEEAQAALSAKEAEVEDLKQKMAEGLSEAQVFVTSHVQPCCTACSCTVIDSACHVGIAPSQRHWWLAHTARVCTDEVPSRPLDAEAQCCSTLQMALM